MPPEDGSAYYVEAGGADRVLVAYPEHRIEVLATTHYEARLHRGISRMEIELDFYVA
jgi:hypothetical protein